ncbi:hypothetical protein, partial [Acetomicrobium sp. S15 = DSM 107314]|uniref:hypothetical protein n=1 Tax=Acetomicrobium sp. S15 = DSM 107314 TaxID=2529858 RepID=UPI0018E1098C
MPINDIRLSSHFKLKEFQDNDPVTLLDRLHHQVVHFAIASKRHLYRHAFRVMGMPINGSGKSNVLDALRFVLGDSSPVRLRISRLSDLMFQGSPS